MVETILDGLSSETEAESETLTTESSEINKLLRQQTSAVVELICCTASKPREIIDLLAEDRKQDLQDALQKQLGNIEKANNELSQNFDSEDLRGSITKFLTRELTDEESKTLPYIIFCKLLNLKNESNNIELRQKFVLDALNIITQQYFSHFYLMAKAQAENLKNKKGELNKQFIQNARAIYPTLFKLCFLTFPQQTQIVMDQMIATYKSLYEVEKNDQIRPKLQLGIMAIFTDFQKGLEECPPDTRKDFIDDVKIYYKFPEEQGGLSSLSQKDFEKILMGGFYLKSWHLTKTAYDYLLATIKLTADHTSRTALESFITSDKNNAQLVANFLYRFEAGEDYPQIMESLGLIALPGGDKFYTLFPPQSRSYQDCHKKVQELEAAAKEPELTPEEKISALEKRVKELEEERQVYLTKEVEADNAALSPQNLTLETENKKLAQELRDAKRALLNATRAHLDTLGERSEKSVKDSQQIFNLVRLNRKLAGQNQESKGQIQEIAAATKSLNDELKRARHSQDILRTIIENLKSSPDRAEELSELEAELKKAQSTSKELQDQVDKLANIRTQLETEYSGVAAQLEEEILRSQELEMVQKEIVIQNTELSQRLYDVEFYAQLLTRPLGAQLLLDDVTLANRAIHTAQTVINNFASASSSLFDGVATNVHIYYGSKVYYYILGAAYRGLKGNPAGKDYDMQIAVDNVEEALAKIRENAHNGNYTIEAENSFVADDKKKGANIKLRHPVTLEIIDITISEGKVINVGGGFQFFGQKPFIDAKNGLLGIFGTQNIGNEYLEFLRQVQINPNFIYQINLGATKLFEGLFLKDNFSDLPPEIYSDPEIYRRIVEEFEQKYYAQVKQVENFEQFVLNNFSHLLDQENPKDERYERLRGLFLNLQNQQISQEKTTIEAESAARIAAMEEQFAARLKEMEQQFTTRLEAADTATKEQLKTIQTLQTENASLKTRLEHQPPQEAVSSPTMAQTTAWRQGSRLPAAITNQGTALPPASTKPRKAQPVQESKNTTAEYGKVTILKRDDEKQSGGR